jgi:hypothetical protein
MVVGDGLHLERLLACWLGFFSGLLMEGVHGLGGCHTDMEMESPCVFIVFTAPNTAQIPPQFIQLTPPCVSMYKRWICAGVLSSEAMCKRKWVDD